MSRPPEIQFDKLKHRVKWAIDANVVSVSSKDCILTIIPYLREKFLEYKAYKDEVMSDNINNALSQIAAELASKTDVAVAKQVVMSLNQSRNISGSKRTMPDEGSEPNETLPVIPSEPVNPSSENKEGKDNKPNGKAGTKKAPRIEGTADAPKEVKERKSPFSFPTPTQRLRDIAGVDSILTTLQKVVFMPVKNPNWVSEVNLALKSSILIHGPAGCGKTLLANAVAGELGLPYFETSGPDLISSMSGDSEKNIKDLFAAAMAAAPSVLFIDGFDAIAAGGEVSSSVKCVVFKIILLW
jgi:ribosome biogenesis ATPase